MPSHYAHHRFGQDILSSIPAEDHRRIQRFRQLYTIGLQGPDLFFHHNPFWKTELGNLATQIHHLTGREFFDRACAVLKENPSEGATAFLYGLLAHYCLDSRVHPLVHRETEDGRIGHVELETEFERYLLTLDGHVPAQLFRMSGHYRLTRGECVTVSLFFAPATPANIHGCLKNMRFFDRFLTGKNRALLRTVMIFLPENVQQYLMTDHPNHKCFHLDEALLGAYEQAAAEYPLLLEELNKHIHHGTPLGAEFDALFG